MNNKNLSYRVFSCSTLGAAMLLAGCATAPEVTAADAPAAKVESAEVAPLSIVKPREVVDSTPPAPGSYGSLVNKLQSNGLYWREKQSYSYHIGKDTGAEFQPDSGLKVIGSTDTGSVECNFKADGSFSSDKKIKNTCEQIMFTLDQELGD